MEVEARPGPLVGENRGASGIKDARVEDRSKAANRYLMAKRLLDLAVASSALVLLAPVFLIISILIKLDSRGPVFHRRRVVAQNGHSPHPVDPSTVRTFDAFKFRTMTPDADSVLTMDESLLREYLKNYKLDSDPRITRLGEFLRKTNLDELPQFFNVLIGQMSVVGPRIITPPEMEKYGRMAGRLLTVRPGMSGLWQVLRGSDHSYNRRVAMDMVYIKRRNIWLDIVIIVKTAGVALGRRGSG
ncbi:MAG: sugar transferase [Armatimonadota bacterium]|nr:sugar transferase [Armatimonadota bacterium]